MSIITDAVDLADARRRNSPQVVAEPPQYLFGGRPPTLDNMNGGVNDGNRLQMAQALGAARQQGQSATSGNYLMGGVSPLQDAVRRSKALSASSIDQTSLSDEQRDMLTRMQQDPNVDYNSFTNAVGQLRSSQATQLKSQQFDDREKRLSDRSTQVDQQKQQADAQRLQTQQGRVQITNLRKQQQEIETQAKQLEKENYGLDSAANEKEFSQGDAGAANTFRKYRDLKSQSSAIQQQLDAAVSNIGKAPAATAASATPAKPTLRMQGRTLTNLGPSDMQDAGGLITNSKLPDNSQGVFSSASAAQPGFRGPLPSDYSQHYLAAAGGDPNKAAQLASQDGWAVPGVTPQQQQETPGWTHPQTGASYTEGQVLHSPSTGRMFKIVSGQPVEIANGQ